jgi:hypothetical protein
MAQRRQEVDAEFRKLQADIEDRYQQRKLKLDESFARMGMMERLVSQGLNTGAADSSVLNTMLQQATEQEYATTSDDKVRARSEAQAAANNLDTFKQAEDRERQHQAKMTGLASDMMQAAKQQPPNTVVTGAGAQPPTQPSSGPVIINNTPGTPAGQPSPGNVQAACDSCGKPVEAGWKTCPHCGQALGASTDSRCPKCSAKVQQGWKACPGCGTRLDSKCAECGAELQADWKVCPSCGTKR